MASDALCRDAYLDGALGLLLASLISYGELAPQEGAELRSILAAAYDEGEERGRAEAEQQSDDARRRALDEITSHVLSYQGEILGPDVTCLRAFLSLRLKRFSDDAEQHGREQEGRLHSGRAEAAFNAGLAEGRRAEREQLRGIACQGDDALAPALMETAALDAATEGGKT